MAVIESDPQDGGRTELHHVPETQEAESLEEVIKRLGFGPRLRQLLDLSEQKRFLGYVQRCIASYIHEDDQEFQTIQKVSPNSLIMNPRRFPGIAWHVRNETGPDILVISTAGNRIIEAMGVTDSTECAYLITEGLTRFLAEIVPPDRLLTSPWSPWGGSATAVRGGFRNPERLGRVGRDGSSRAAIPDQFDVDVAIFNATQRNPVDQIYEGLQPPPEAPKRDYVVTLSESRRRNAVRFISVKMREVPELGPDSQVDFCQIFPLQGVGGEYPVQSDILGFVFGRTGFRQLFVVLQKLIDLDGGYSHLGGYLIDLLNTQAFARIVSVNKNSAYERKYSGDIVWDWRRAFPLNLEKRNGSNVLAAWLHDVRARAWAAGISLAIPDGWCPCIGYPEQEIEGIAQRRITNHWQLFARQAAIYSFSRILKPIADNPDILGNEGQRSMSAVALTAELFDAFNGDALQTLGMGLSYLSHIEDTVSWGCGLFDLFYPKLARFLSSENGPTGKNYQEELIKFLSLPGVYENGNGGALLIDYLLDHLPAREVAEILVPSFYKGSAEEFIEEVIKTKRCQTAFKRIKAGI